MIRPIRNEDVEAYVALRREALVNEPMSFASSVDDDLVSDPEVVREQIRKTPDTVIIGAFRGDLVGVVGLYRDRHDKMAHKTHIWGMYVTPAHRRQGIGRALIDAALDHARSMAGVALVHLSVSSETPAARKLYESSGFTIWGDEPDAIRHEGRSASELHMALDLKDGYDRSSSIAGSKGARSDGSSRS